jgi:acetyl esterase/lipase
MDRGIARLGGLAAIAASLALSGRPLTAAPRIGVWQSPNGLVQQRLWPGTPPDSPAKASPPEHSETGINPKRFAGLPVTGLYDVSIPTLTIFPARGKANRAAVLVFPGGGFQQLAIDLEGSEACDWLNARGFVCVLVKYRVPNSNHHYDASCNCGVTPKHLTAFADAQRAIRLVRSRAAPLGVDPNRIGAMGFSAGGYLVAQTSNITTPAYKPVDSIDRISSRPNFAIALYPGHLCRDGVSLEPGIKVTKATPPTFLVQAWDDPTDPICNSTQYARALAEAGVPAEIHLFANGGHAFGLRPTGTPVDHWLMLLEDWLKRLPILHR